MSEVSEGGATRYRLLDYAALAGAVPIAGFLAYGAARVVRPSFCTLGQQLRVWSGVFLALLAILVFAFENHRHHEFRPAAIRTLAFVAFTGLLVGVLLPNLFGAVSRSRQLGTRADLRTIGHAVEAVRSTSGSFPTASSVAALGALTGERLPERDRWSNSLVLHSEPSRYVIISFGECGRSDQPDPWAYPPGPTHDVQADIVWLNGKLWRYPEGIQDD